MLDIDFASWDLPLPTASLYKWILMSGPTSAWWYPFTLQGRWDGDLHTKTQDETQTLKQLVLSLFTQQIRMAMLSH